MNIHQEFEKDPIFPSGEWTGFFLEEHRSGRGWMHLYINFAENTMQGEGTDYVGPWHIRGRYEVENGQCHWVKQYLDQHRVNYQGTASDKGIIGQWEIEFCSSGTFHIWPKHRTEIQQLYLEQDLDERMPIFSQLASTVASPGFDFETSFTESSTHCLHSPKLQVAENRRHARRSANPLRNL